MLEKYFQNKNQFLIVSGEAGAENTGGNTAEILRIEFAEFFGP